MLTFAVGLLILSFAVALLGIMLDEVYPWGDKVVVAGTIMLCVSLTCLAGCVFYYGIHV
jgi:hypothetical protein|nr:MAG TPA: hypothetical protein [Caudoviricetes sp.]